MYKKPAAKHEAAAMIISHLCSRLYLYGIDFLLLL
jgi:hypothetical protein